jgi:hypothetical protein
MLEFEDQNMAKYDDTNTCFLHEPQQITSNTKPAITELVIF